MPPMAPPMPPKPTTEPTAARGNVSDVSVYKLALQPWWAAVAKQSSKTVSQRLPPVNMMPMTGSAERAQMSIEVLRARVRSQPFLTKNDESQPPPIEPISAER